MNRVTLAVATSVALGLTGCADATAPPRATLPDPPPSEHGGTAPFSSLGVLLDDATSVFIVSISDSDTRVQFVSVLESLSRELIAGRREPAGVQLTRANAILSKLSGQQATELAPIGLALDQIESALNPQGTR